MLTVDGSNNNNLSITFDAADKKIHNAEVRALWARIGCIAGAILLVPAAGGLATATFFFGRWIFPIWITAWKDIIHATRPIGASVFIGIPFTLLIGMGLLIGGLGAAACISGTVQLGMEAGKQKRDFISRAMKGLLEAPPEVRKQLFEKYRSYFNLEIYSKFLGSFLTKELPCTVQDLVTYIQEFEKLPYEGHSYNLAHAISISEFKDDLTSALNAAKQPEGLSPAPEQA